MDLLNVVMFLLISSLYVRDSEQQIPLSVLRRVQEMNVTDFLGNIRNENKTEPDNTTSILFPGDAETASSAGVGVVAASLAVGAEGCAPEEELYAFPTPADPNVLYIPECTNVKMCGGCCMSDSLECTNITSTPYIVQVINVRYDHEKMDFIYSGMTDFTLWEHTSCGCECKVREEHCNKNLHEYEEDACRCKCYNELQATQCLDKIWDPRECDCVCPKILECDWEHEIFDHDTCKCTLDLGDPIVIPSDEAGAASRSPCVGVTCRAGYSPVPMQDECRCRMSNTWDGVEAASSKSHEYNPAEVPLQLVPNRPDTTSTTTTTTTTTTPTTTRRPRRQRPRRPINGRGNQG